MQYSHSPNKTTVHQPSNVLFCNLCSIATYQTKQYICNPMCCFEVHVVIATPQTKHYISHLMCCFAIYVVMPLPKQNINTSAIQFVGLRLMSLLPLPKQNTTHHHPMCCFEVREVIATPQTKQHTPPSNVLF